MKGIDTNSANVIKMIAAGGNRRMRRRQMEGKSFKAKEGGPLFLLPRSARRSFVSQFFGFLFCSLVLLRLFRFQADAHHPANGQRTTHRLMFAFRRIVTVVSDFLFLNVLFSHQCR